MMVLWSIDQSVFCAEEVIITLHCLVLVIISWDIVQLSTKHRLKSAVNC